MKAFVKGFLKGLAGCAVLVVFVLAFCHFTGMTDWVKDSGQSMPAAADISQGEAEEEKIDEQKPDEQLPFKEQENSQPSIDQAPAEEETDVRILFAGDIYLPEALQSKYTKEGIPAIATEGVLTEMQDADLFVVNQEFPFGTTGEPMEDKQYTFRIHPKYVSVEEDLGVDLVTLANNHVLDYGRSPLAETLDTLKQAGIAYMGAGTDLKEASECKSFTIQNKKIGFLGASRVIPVAEWNAGKGVSGVFTTYDPARLLEEIEKAKETCDFVVVYVHWGIERNTIPEDYQRSLGQAYIEAGADAVI